MKTFTIDATNRSLGRVASEIATILRGKNSPEFERHIFADNKVTVTNASKVRLSGKKADQKTYAKYSGYPGGLKKRSLDYVVTKKGYAEIIKNAVHGMLPDNRLRNKMMKNLTIEE